MVDIWFGGKNGSVLTVCSQQRVATINDGDDLGLLEVQWLWWRKKENIGDVNGGIRARKREPVGDEGNRKTVTALWGSRSTVARGKGNKMSIEPTSIEGSVTPSTLVGEALSQMKGTTGKRKATPQSHKGESIGMVIEKCLLNRGIDKLFTVIVDNASSNDVAIGYLRKKFNPRGALAQNGAVRYVRQTLARLQNFKECVVVEKIECKKMLCLDVCTRWDSTYLMLDTVQNFERAFERFEEHDTNFRVELEREEGWPSMDDRASVRNLRDFLEHFYEVTLHISGTSYVMSNKFFDEISEIDILLRDTQSNINVDFNPRQKLKYLAFALSEKSNFEKACEMMQKLKEDLYGLFDEYKPSLHSTCSQSSVSAHVSLGELQQKMKRRMQALYKKRELENGGEDKTSGLDKYLDEANEDFVEDFDILLWWKVNSLRFPGLLKMAGDVLAIPVSTVASESAFSTGGCVLDQYRSSLTPKIVQALV
ncbi:zinc finger BED domain-containing protein RICESLEEPER 2-like [Gossypium hirsutum]|uniref:Zinc finger BED domain-containing protein RICESLEEPER 2-like n=1 Tax=Gossypium hirsutum TaxID=3635 RepID=A0ABM3AMN5_GOSHI|nr:zinc finger BED domain-containing protein RICESLEEPER 2-like [Gossypium hirsutum]